MTIPFWCLSFMIFLPYALSTLGGYLRIRRFGYYDNKNPRAQAAQLEGMGPRIYAAQQNTWESVIVFAVAVLVAHLAGAEGAASATAAVLFVVLRVLYCFAYALDWDRLRTLLFMAAMGCCVWLLALAIVA